ncbi:MAG: metal-dependent hydrolase [Chloroflexi bacterium]|nr:metal-dependent hydrolase [Chloroflexota bacterium]
MPTIFSHVAPALVVGLALGRERISRPLLIWASIAAISPDFDGISFWLDMPRGTLLSHRGFTHSVGFATIIASVGAFFAPRLGCKRWVAGLTLFLAVLSHPLYDMLTNGGSGVALG